MAITLTDTELEQLNRVGSHKRKPVATLAYEPMSKGLKTSR